MDFIFESKKKESQAKKINKLKRLLKKGIVEFSYWKKDGSLRKAKGTLKDSLLPKTDKKDKRKRNLSDKCIYYYDLRKDDYRAFLKDNLKDIKEM